MMDKEFASRENIKMVQEIAILLMVFHHLFGFLYISDKLTILHGQSDHLSRRFRSPISERDSQQS